MPITKVTLTSDAMMACLVHALSTEREEIMGAYSVLDECIRPSCLLV